MKPNSKSHAGTNDAQSDADDGRFASSPSAAKPTVVCSQSPAETEVIKIVRILLNKNKDVPAHIEYMRYKNLTIVSKSYLRGLELVSLIGWCLAIIFFLPILLLMVL